MWCQLIPSWQCTDIFIVAVLCVILCNLTCFSLPCTDTLPPLFPAYLLKCWTPGVQEPSEQTTQLVQLDFVVCCSKHQSQHWSQQGFGVFSSFISLQQNTIDVSTCLPIFMAIKLWPQKAITLGFWFHRQCTWEFTAGSSLGECRQLHCKLLLRQNYFNKVATQL